VDATSLLADLRLRSHPTLVVEPEPEIEPRSVALLAGSFDPITVAHAAMADAASRFAELVLFVYSARTLPKDPGAPPPLLPEPSRVEWLRRFVAERPGRAAGLCSHGLVSEQAEAAAGRFPRARLYLAMGSDKLLQVLHPRWYRDRDATLSRMFELAEIVFAMRSGDEAAVAGALDTPGNHPWRPRIRRLEVPPDVASVSSRRVRDRLARGEDAADLVPDAIRPALAQRWSGGS
jgi:nicotinic acid mononucleotide adenylyltransferase